MKKEVKRIDGHLIVKTGLSLYIDGKMEYQAVNLITEYGQKLNGCRYAVASEHSQKEMEQKYSEELAVFAPYIFLTKEEFCPIRESQKNNDKYQKKELRDHELYGFSEELTEITNECCFLSEEEPNALEAMIELIDIAEFAHKEDLMRQALNTLTDTQRRRLVMCHVSGMTSREIADAEGTAQTAIVKSIHAAEKKIVEYFKKES